MKFSKSNRLYHYINRMNFLINCDLGEIDLANELENDKTFLRYIDMANIACGGHAGSDEVMIELLNYCKRLDVLPGAHPSYPDRQNFGRSTLPATTDDIRRWTIDQVQCLAKHASIIGVKLHHIKPHGALYHDAMNDVNIAEAFVHGVLDANKSWKSAPANFHNVGQSNPTTLPITGQSNPATIHIVGQSGSKLEQVCNREGLPFLSEAFADRKYLPTGALQSRAIPGSVLNRDEAIEQVKYMMSTSTVNSTNGPIPIKFDTICVHGDSPDALSILESISKL